MRLTRQLAKTPSMVYQIEMDGVGIIFIGATRTDDIVANLAHAERNSDFRASVPMDAPLTITILSAHATVGEAVNAAGKLINKHLPSCNIRGHQNTLGKRVRCLSDMKEFANAHQAAKAYNIAPSALSNHLNNKPYYNSVGGHRFERISE